MKAQAEQVVDEIPGVLPLTHGREAPARRSSRTPPTLQLTATREHLRQLVVARAVVLAALFLYAAAQLLAGQAALPSRWAVALFLAAVLVNAATFGRLRLAASVSHAEFLLQILVDVVLLAAALHHSGGNASPLVLLYFVPLTIAAATLPLLHTGAVFLAVLAMHELVCVYLPGYDALQINRTHDLVELLAALLIAFFVHSMARTSRKHDLLLRRVREDFLKQRHLADLGALAAHAAHQLSSPLATIAVLVGDLRAGAWHAEDTRQALDVMAGEIKTCKDVSSRLLASAGYDRAEAGGRMPADRFLAAIVDRCQLMQPWMTVHCRQEGSSPAPEIVAEASLEHAILVLLDCARGVSRRVEISQRWDHERLQIRISHDERGALGAADQAELLMARHTVDWFGGTIHEATGSDGRSSVTLSLPLANLRVPARAEAR